MARGCEVRKLQRILCGEWGVVRGHSQLRVTKQNPNKVPLELEWEKDIFYEKNAFGPPRALCLRKGALDLPNAKNPMHPPGQLGSALAPKGPGGTQPGVCQPHMANE